jgi:hypothetical protein
MSRDTLRPASRVPSITADARALMQEDQFEVWLNGPPQEAFQLLASYDAVRMRIVQSGRDLEDLVGADSPVAGMLL